jgi:hypothetical protein
MSKITPLKDLQVLASGATRDVYRHPINPEFLIKVVRQTTTTEGSGNNDLWYKSYWRHYRQQNRRYRHLIPYLREVREYIAIHALEEGSPPSWLQKIVGFVETDRGLGLVVEAIFAEDGKLAPTLRTMARSGPLKPEEQAALDFFLKTLIRSPIALTDIQPNNIVYGISDNGTKQFVLIDGTGHKTLIPIVLMSQWINKWNNRRKVRRLLAELANEICKTKNNCVPA